MNNENTDFEELFAEYYDKLYFDGYAESIKESDPARYHYELTEFIGYNGLPEHTDEDAPEPLALDQLPVETLVEVGRGRVTYRGTGRVVSVFLVRIKGKEYPVTYEGLHDLQLFGAIPFAAPYRGESQFVKPFQTIER